MQKNFVIIGCGRIAWRHAEQMAYLGNVKAVCDIVPARANELAAAYQATPYYTIEDLLEAVQGVDLASICTPNGLHAAHAIRALQSGLHVLCEKPLCIHVADGMEMINAATRASKKLFVVKSTRYNPAVVAVKKLLNGNGLGKVYSFQLNCVWNRPPAYYTGSWRGTAGLDGGTLYTQFSHYLDVLLWFLGEERSMAGFRKNLAHGDSIHFEDTGAVALEMLSGAIGTIHYSVNAFHKNQEVSLTLIAEKGTIKLGGEYMNDIVYQQPELIDIAALKAGGSANDYGFYKGSMSNHDQVYQNVMLALSGEEHTVTDGMDGLKTVGFIERIYQQINL